LKRKILILGAAVMLAGISLTIYYCYNIRTRNAVENLIQQKKIINILVAGSNVFKDHKHKFFSIISINPENNRIGITFIPPAFKIRLDDDGDRSARIDEVVVFNFNRIRYSLQKDLKLNIPFYIELSSPDVERMINLFEGVNIFILEQMKNASNIDFGVNYFDGQKVVRYINSVDENSIYLKYDRILDVILTLYENKEQLDRFHNAEFIHELLKSIKTNILPQEILRLTGIIFKDGDVMATTVPGFFKDGFYATDDITYRIYEKEFLKALIVNRSEKEIDSSIKIKIVNGTDVPGLARKMRERLIREGLNVVEFGTSPFRKMNKSVIINKRASIVAVNRVSELTGIDNRYHVIDNTQLFNVMIIIGEDMAK
jgi:anionic cell wall polymer biosynthesis LytR-Cps2A-Psr (LCP) family protein